MGKGRKFHSLKCPKNFERVDVFIVLTCLFCEHDKVMSACTLDHTGLLSLDGCRRVLTNFFYPQRKSLKFMWTRTTSLREKTWKLRSNFGRMYYEIYFWYYCFIIKNLLSHLLSIYFYVLKWIEISKQTDNEKFPKYEWHASPHLKILLHF